MEEGSQEEGSRGWRSRVGARLRGLTKGQWGDFLGKAAIGSPEAEEVLVTKPTETSPVSEPDKGTSVDKEEA